MTPSNLSVGLLLPTRELQLSRKTDLRLLLSLAAAAETAGFNSLWVGDSALARPRPEPLVVLGAVAATTSTITLGTAALTAVLRHPLLAAWQIATLDQMCNGRLVLGLGAGFPYPESVREIEAFGVPASGRGQRLEEIVALWRHLWSGDAGVPFESEHFRYNDLSALPVPCQPGGPPLWMAAGTAVGLDRTGRLFDGWLPYLPDPTSYGEALETVLASAASVGVRRDLTPALYATVWMGEDDAKGRAALDAYCQAYYGVAADVISSFQAITHGPPTAVADWIESFREVGARHIVLRLATLDAETQMDEAAQLLDCLRVSA